MRNILLNRGYLSLVVTQFFGAANDNILKTVLTFMVIRGIWQGQLGPGGQGIVGLCFTVPFIFLSGYAGQFTDRNSKRYVSVLVKVIEIPIAIVGMLGFWTGNVWMTLFALLALTAQSSFFGPSKYGMIPEIVPLSALSRANGFINMMTNIAIIIGTIAGGVISDAYAPAADPNTLLKAEPMPWLPGVVMVAIAIAGLFAVVWLPKLAPGDRTLQYSLNPVSTYITSIRDMAKSPLLVVAIAWGYFYLLAGMALLIIPEYTVILKSYGVDDTETSYLLATIGIAIGFGSATAGLISGHRIEPRLVPIGGLGLALSMILLGLVPPSVSPDPEDKYRMFRTTMALFIFGAGFSAGFYIIPLQAMVQKLSPDNERGRFLGTSSAISFSFLAISSLLYIAIKPLPFFAANPHRIFLVSAFLMLAGLAYFMYHLRHTMIRYGKANLDPASLT